MFKNNLFVHLDGGSMNEADGCSQWFLSLRSVASGLEKPLLAGYGYSQLASLECNAWVCCSQYYRCITELLAD